MKKKFVIIGTSAAGIACANRLRQLDANSDIVCISDEIESPYNKCMLADYASGTKQEHEVYTLTKEQAQLKNITLLLGKKVIDINTQKKYITLNDSTEFNYDALLLGVGTSPRMPDIKNAEPIENLFTFHRLRDIHHIIAYIKKQNAQKAIIVGSGLSGLECADSLLVHHIKITVVEQKDRVLSTQIDAQGSLFIQNKMEESGILFLPQSCITNIEIKNNKIRSVQISDGQTLECDFIIFAIGLQPNLVLAQQAGIAIHNEGIITNEYMQTSISDIYAAGDIALVHDQLIDQKVASRTWPDAMLQGLIAAHAMAGQHKKYPGIASVISSSFFGVKFASCGPVVNHPESYEKVVNQQGDFYHLFLIEQGIVKGFLLVGNINAVGKLRQLLLTKTQVSREQLLSL